MIEICCDGYNQNEIYPSIFNQQLMIYADIDRDNIQKNVLLQIQSTFVLSASLIYLQSG